MLLYFLWIMRAIPSSQSTIIRTRGSIREHQIGLSISVFNTAPQLYFHAPHLTNPQSIFPCLREQIPHTILDTPFLEKVAENMRQQNLTLPIHINHSDDELAFISCYPQRRGTSILAMWTHNLRLHAKTTEQTTCSLTEWDVTMDFLARR